MGARSIQRGGTGGMLVQRYVGRAREIAVLIADDTTFGPTVTFGRGGTRPDPIDRAVDLPSLNLALAKALIRRRRTGAMLAQPLRLRFFSTMRELFGTEGLADADRL